MSKFLLTGVLLVLLASFLHYSPASSNTDDKKTPRSEIVLFHISEQVRLARLDRHMTTKELATKVGLTKFDVEKIEAGKAVPTRELLFKIEQALNTSLTIDSY